MDEQPLKDKKIMITRAREQSGDFAARLRDLGAEVIEFPTIEIVPPLSWKKLDEAVGRLASYDWIIFTSVNGVDFFWQRLKGNKNQRIPSSLKVCAIGPATRRRLEKHGTPADYTPKEFIAEAILEGFKKMGAQGKRILLARVKKARDILPKGLREMGAVVDVVETYRTIKPRGGSKRLKEILTEEQVDAITFTSSSTVNHFIDLLKKEDVKRLLRGVAIASIGPVTSRTARDRGMEVHIQPEEYTIPALTDAIVDYFAKSPKYVFHH